MEIADKELLGIHEVSNSNPPRDPPAAIDSLTDGAGMTEFCA